VIEPLGLYDRLLEAISPLRQAPRIEAQLPQYAHWLPVKERVRFLPLGDQSNEL